MKQKKRQAVMAIALVMFVAGCAEKTPNPSGKEFQRVVVSGGPVYRFDDDERGVTCYVYYSYGISCVRP